MRRSNGVIYLIICVLWIGAIFLFSSQNAQDSYGLSNKVAETIGGVLFPDFSGWPYNQRQEWISGTNALLRKLAHFAEYCLLGILSTCALSALFSARKRKGAPTVFKTGMLAFYPCLLVALADEVIQISSAGRTSSTADVILDCVGVVVGIFIAVSKIQAKPVAPAQSAVVRKHRRG